jgi:hypothetical protein
MLACRGLGRCLEADDSDPFPLAGWCGLVSCLPVRCPNFLLCRRQDPAVMMDAVGGRCLLCNMEFGRSLTFFKPAKGEECPICLECESLQMRLPGCTHSVCLPCYRLTPRPFRCPLCRAEHPPPFSGAHIVS